MSTMWFHTFLSSARLQRRTYRHNTQRNYLWAASSFKCDPKKLWEQPPTAENALAPRVSLQTPRRHPSL